MRFWKRMGKAPAVSYEQARDVVRRATEPGWSVGTYFLDDRFILETDRYYWFTVGAREHLVDGGNHYLANGPDPVVDKRNGKLRWLPAHEIGWDPTLRRTPNPNPTCDGPLPPSVGRHPTYEEARELVRRETEPGWTLGTYCLDDRTIRENDEYYVFTVGAREFILDGDFSYAIAGGLPIVYKADGRLDGIASPQVAFDDTLRTRDNPNPTLNLDSAGQEDHEAHRDSPPESERDEEVAPTPLTYAIIFRDPVTDEDVDQIADAMLQQRGYSDPPEQLYAQAVAESTDERRTPKERDYLQRLVRVLDAKRPWPTLPYTGSLATKTDLAHVCAVGSVPLSQTDITDRLGHGFQPAGRHAGHLMRLRLDTGHSVILRARSRTEPPVAILTESDADAEETLAAFRDRTGLPAHADPDENT